MHFPLLYIEEIIPLHLFVSSRSPFFIIMFSIILLLLYTIMVMVALSRLFSHSRSTRKKAYLVEFSCYKPDSSTKCSNEAMIERMRCYVPNYTEDTLNFIREVSEVCGLGSSTYVPKALLKEPPFPCLAEARKEAEAVMFGAVDELLAKAKVKAEEIGIVVVNCSLFNPVPSLADMIVNRYKLKETVLNYNISGMGCSAGLHVIGLVKHLLQVHENSYALVVSTENITENLYLGNESSMLAANCLFRVGGAATLLSNRPKHAKYELIHTVHTNIASSDLAYGCIFHDEDSEGQKGIVITKDLLVEASKALTANLTTLGRKILLIAANNYLLRKKPYMIPNLRMDHFFPHPGGKPVLDALQRTLNLKARDVEAARMTLYRFGNTSSSSIWYELAYSEAKGRIKKGDLVWQMAYGSGFKCSSVIWRAIAAVDRWEICNAWSDEIDEFPVSLDPCKTTNYFC
ncbi:hypothetical protein Dimus_023946 [Dionaea muscipula]